MLSLHSKYRQLVSLFEKLIVGIFIFSIEIRSRDPIRVEIGFPPLFLVFFFLKRRARKSRVRVFLL